MASLVSLPTDATGNTATIGTCIDTTSPGTNKRVGVIYMGGNKVRFFTYPTT